jgi:hypothetical protein
MQQVNVSIRTNQIIDEVWAVEIDPSITIKEAKQRIMDDPFAIWGSGMYATLWDSEVVDTVGVTLDKIHDI